MSFSRNIEDPYIQYLSIKFWLRYLFRRISYFLPPSVIKNFFLMLSGLNIGKNVFVGDSVKFIDGYQKNKIYLKDNCVISPCCVLIATSYPYKSNLRLNSKLIQNKEITIENDVWIGANSTILPGVIIEKNSILGAGSVLTANIKKNEIWVGNPAKFLKTIE